MSAPILRVDGTEVRRRGCLFIVSGPSGSGKTSIAGPVLAALGDDLKLSVSVTTRGPRAGEEDGVDYHFIDDAEFKRRVDTGGLAEWAEVHPVFGTQKPPLTAEESVSLRDIPGGTAPSRVADALASSKELTEIGRAIVTAEREKRERVLSKP